MATAFSNSPPKNANLETYCLIWTDTAVNSSREVCHVQQQLQTTIDHLLTFEDEHQCLSYIKNVSNNDRVILIASGRFGRQIVPQINHLRQINSIFIYCMDKRANEQWSRPYSKVKGIVTRVDELIGQIQIDYTQQQETKLEEPLTIKILENNSKSSDQFIQFQLLLDCLIRMESSIDDKYQLISFCKNYYKSNYSQLTMIKEFERTYSLDRSLWWYTRPAFLSRLLNKALREDNIDFLYLCRFVIHDIGYQLGQTRPSSTIHVYRSQLMSKDELQLLKSSVGKILSINAFLSTNMNKEKTRLLLSTINHSENLEKVFLEIEANPRLPNSRPFGDLQSKNYSSKVGEVLFMVGSIFRLEQIKCHHDQIWIIRLSLCSITDQALKPIYHQIKQELGSGQPTLLRFAHLLRHMNRINQAEKYSRRYLNQLPNNHPDLPHCYYALGIVAESKKNLPASLKWYKNSLKIFQQLSDSDPSSLANLYQSIANVYSKMNEYRKAIQSYQKALDLWQKTSTENHGQIIRCLNHLGAVYDMTQEYSEALECYKKALDMAKKNKHPDLAITLRNLANVYELQGELVKALTYYEKSMKIYRNSSSPNDVYLNDIQTSIRRVSSKLK